jgi:hypothetical protein
MIGCKQLVRVLLGRMSLLVVDGVKQVTFKHLQDKDRQPKCSSAVRPCLHEGL